MKRVRGRSGKAKQQQKGKTKKEEHAEQVHITEEEEGEEQKEEGAPAEQQAEEEEEEEREQKETGREEEGEEPKEENEEEEESSELQRPKKRRIAKRARSPLPKQLFASNHNGTVGGTATEEEEGSSSTSVSPFPPSSPVVTRLQVAPRSGRREALAPFIDLENLEPILRWKPEERISFVERVPFYYEGEGFHEALHRLSELYSSPHPQGVLLMGGPGIGKTSLIQRSVQGSNVGYMRMRMSQCTFTTLSYLMSQLSKTREPLPWDALRPQLLDLSFRVLSEVFLQAAALVQSKGLVKLGDQDFTNVYKPQKGEQSSREAVMESYFTLRHALEKETEIARTSASEEETQMEEEQEEEKEKEKEKEAEEKMKARESSTFSIGRNDAFVLHLDDAEVWPADAAFVEAMRHRQQQRREDMLTTDEDISEEDPTFVANVADFPFYYMVGLALALEEIMVEYPTLKVVISGENEYTAQTILTACTRNDQTWWHHMNMPIFTADAARAICDHFYNFSPLPLLSLMQIYELIAYNGRTIQLFLREVMLVFHHNDSVERLMLSILQKCVDRVYINWSTALQKKYTSLMSNFKQRRVLPLQLLMTFRFASLYRARQLPDGSLEMLNVHFPVEWKNIAQCGVFHLREELRHRDERSGFQTTEGRAHTKAGLVHYVIISPPRGLLQRFWVKNAASCPRKDLLSLLRWHLIAEERYLNEDIIARGTLWKRALATELALPSLSMNLGFAPDVSSPSFSPLQRTGSTTPVSPGSFASLLLCIWQKLDPMQATIAPDPASFNRSPVFLADEQTLQYTESFHHRIQCVLSNKGPLRGGVPSQVDLGLPFVDSSGKEVKVWARLVLGGLTGNDYQNLCINFFSKGRASTRTGDLTSPDQAHPQHFLRIFISGDNFLPVIPLNKLKLEVPLPSSPFAPATRTEQGRTSPRSPVGEELKSPSSEPIQEPIRILATFHRMVDPDLRLSLFSIMEGAMALLSRCLMPLLLSPDVLSPEQDRFSRQADLMGADLRDMVQQVLPHLVDAGAKEIRTSTYASPPPTPTPKAEKVLFVRQPHDTRNTAMKEIIMTEFTVANLKEAAAEACGRAASDVVEITRSVSGAAGMKVAITSDRQVAKLTNESIITVEFSNHEQVE